MSLRSIARRQMLRATRQKLASQHLAPGTWHRLILPLLIALAFAARPAGAQRYTIRDLGSLGGTYGQALGVNAAGHVVGNSNVKDNRDYHAFLYRGDDLIDLGTLGGTRSSGIAINNAGHVVGFAFLARNLVSRACLWDGGTLKDLGAFVPGSRYSSSALDINDAGHIVGWSATREGFARAFLYEGAALKDLGTLGGSNSQATGISNTGIICGDSQIKARRAWRAFSYQEGAMKDLGTLGGDESHAKDVNDLGQVTGWSLVGSRPRAFLYTGGAMQPLGTLGGTESIANGINNAGQVVGKSLIRGTTIPHAFLWEKGTMVDVNSLLPADSGWVVREALRIADGGQIVGHGVYKNRIRPCLLTPTTATP